jgi:NAD(P)-dependent dehydrogenase (short-subunit alcohol dehydrogenase family)
MTDPDLDGALVGDFTGRTAVVTGAGQGIGAAIARGLAQHGAHVVLSGRHKSTIEAVRATIDGDGGSAEAIVADVTDLKQLERLMERAGGADSVIDILINNAGIAGPTAALVDVTLEDWNATLSVNLTGVFLACKAALPYIAQAEHGRIVNIGSVTGKQPLPNRTPYAAAKLGVVGLTRTLAHELGPLGISVNVVSPWLVGGDRLEAVIGTMAKELGVSADELRAEMTAGTAFKRTVTEADVVATALFLCSPLAGNITGQDLNVSAGAVMY